MNIPFVKLFSSDKSASKRTLLGAVARHLGTKLGIVFEDMESRDLAKLPTADLYIAGPPCQPYSKQGLNKGLQDPGNRGIVLFLCVAALRKLDIQSKYKSKL